jgi:hypothetical protein
MSGDNDAIALAERVLAVLAEGSFSATYKFALFTAILCGTSVVSHHGTPCCHCVVTKSRSDQSPTNSWRVRSPSPGFSEDHVALLQELTHWTQERGARDEEALVVEALESMNEHRALMLI